MFNMIFMWTQNYIHAAKHKNKNVDQDGKRLRNNGYRQKAGTAKDHKVINVSFYVLKQYRRTGNHMPIVYKLRSFFMRSR